MAEVVNLRLARKAKARAEKASQAAANRAAFGESKAAKAARKAEAERTGRQIDGHKREPD
ncbi:DUF4169 family protein [Alteraurantiacibacter buctensis]|uniref:DUF4169 family protein n=1 Tax=Alteraurantiacibacter buctensis TaxID=1503981 RepID=A0A844YV98_9SPHN|nr:DUF4169 family protein [Alteraurantiacibacter buctensis]MXO71469.1 DUF4169 family protein [Alteraurantiacibacter buctensis]